jgi:hypothetical protein
MSKNQSFEEKYPNLTDFVYSQGKIEIGYDYNTKSFVIAYDEGGTVYQGEDKYNTMDEAFADLENGITEYLEENGIDLNE